MTGELDLRRLAGLEDALGIELPEIVATLTEELGNAVGRAEVSIAAGDLAATALAAHSGRNSALMIDARPMLDALAALEKQARDGNLGAARRALDDIRALWPTLRSRLELAGERAPDL